MPPARLDLPGPRHDALVPALRHGPVADGDERGLPGPRGPRAHRPLPAARPAGRVAARLDDDAVDAGGERRRGGRARPALRQGPAGRRRVLARPRARSSRCSGAPFEVVEERAGADLVGWRYAGPFDELPAVARRVRGERGYEHRVVAWTEVGEEEGTGIVHIAPGCGAEDFALGKSLGLPVIGPIDEDGPLLPGVRLAVRPRGARDRRVDRRRPRAARVLLPPRGVHPPLPALLAVQHPAAVPPRRRVVHQHGRGLRPAARDADQGSRSTPACATRSWRSWTGSGGSRRSATSASSTGC